MQAPFFTAHNVLLDNGIYTKPESPGTIDKEPVFLSAKHILNLVFPLNKEAFNILDLGCLEGGYTTEFARMGFNATGIEVRDINYECCMYVKNHTRLPNLNFVKDDVLNVERYGIFDAVFCCGLLYHLDRPKTFLEQVASQTRKLIIIQTHFSLATQTIESKFHLSDLITHDGIKGRWYGEFSEDTGLEAQQQMRWSSFQNSKSFWIQREELIELIYKLGFTTVFEQFDAFSPDISNHLQNGYFSNLRGTFIGVRNMG
ncbi:MAG TPA: methyltransferase domain-containing protein [Nitrosomonas europaea]|uniref:class I SAM-dependent methyltransferase n=1 Tax=Nitrosomonas europaea TaxID=915 RepID=UPI0026063D0D|nr:methyltransferase domain-containing protein [Nitrosomonas europaea]HRO57505.1 methyltransferase domain-containing protein [Nitrosomonas europaea]